MSTAGKRCIFVHAKAQHLMGPRPVVGRRGGKSASKPKGSAPVIH